MPPERARSVKIGELPTEHGGICEVFAPTLRNLALPGLMAKDPIVFLLDPVNRTTFLWYFMKENLLLDGNTVEDSDIAKFGPENLDLIKNILVQHSLTYKR